MQSQAVESKKAILQSIKVKINLASYKTDAFPLPAPPFFISFPKLAFQIEHWDLNCQGFFLHTYSKGQRWIVVFTRAAGDHGKPGDLKRGLGVLPLLEVPCAEVEA